VHRSVCMIVMCARIAGKKGRASDKASGSTCERIGDDIILGI
jgi:hypothetical protein